MRISAGAPKAEELFAKLKRSGHLVDVYSDEFFKRQPTYDECDGDAPFYRDGMDEIEILERGENEFSDHAPKNHLLFMHVVDTDTETHELLCEIFPPLKRSLKTEGHKPDFLIFNLFTKQILCMGLGRKCELFAKDATTNSTIDVLGHSNADNDYFDTFTYHDEYEAVSDLAHALHDLGEGLRILAHIPTDSYSLELALNNVNSSDGLHYIDGFDEGYTKQEVNHMMNEIENANSLINSSTKMISVFFPHIEISELNTEDFI